MESFHCPTLCTRIALSLTFSVLLVPAGLGQDGTAAQVGRTLHRSTLNLIGRESAWP